MNKEDGNWQKEFDEEFAFLEDCSMPAGGMSYGMRSVDCREDLKSFISKAVSEARKAERERITKKVTRFEVIDQTKSFEEGGGRCYTNKGIKVELSLQDDERTLKVFLSKE